MGSFVSSLVDWWPLDVLFQTRGYRIRQMVKHNWKPQTFTWPRKTTNLILPSPACRMGPTGDERQLRNEIVDRNPGYDVKWVDSFFEQKS